MIDPIDLARAEAEADHYRELLGESQKSFERLCVWFWIVLGQCLVVYICMVVYLWRNL